MIHANENHNNCSTITFRVLIFARAVKMKAFRSIFLLYSYGASVIYALSYWHSSPSANQETSPTTDDVSEPLFLTPLINAGNLSEARNRSRVPPLLDHIESYAGFFTVNQTSKSHLYFWFIPKTNNDNSSAPLILWLREASTMFSLFNENGPFRITKDGLQKRQYAWTDHYHMLYIDTLVGAGYSFTEADGYVGSNDEVAKYLYAALRQFYQLFPQFRTHDLYIAGDAGTFIPALGYTIHTADRQAGASEIRVPLKGMIIGNGISDSENKIEYATFLHTIGLIDRRERTQLEGNLRRMGYLIRSGKWTQAADEHAKLNADIREMIGEISAYDYTRDSSDLKELMDTHVKYITQDEVRKSIHVGRIKYDVIPSALTDRVRKNFGRPVSSFIEELLKHYRILFYNGQFDLSSSHLLNKSFLRNLHWSGAYDFNEAKKRIWVSGESSVAGYYKVSGNLVYVMVRNAGHLVSFDQPKHGLTLISRFVGGRSDDDSTWWTAKYTENEFSKFLQSD